MNMKYHCDLECINCGRRYSIYEVVYRCEDCGNLLDVVHDIDALKQHTPNEWKQLFEERMTSGDLGRTSGVWSKKEWVCPQIDDDNIVSLDEGNTALLPARILGQELDMRVLHIKQCGISHTGSFKDLGMTVLVSVVNQMRSDDKNIKAIACASTGDTSAALAAYAAAAQIPAIVFLPQGKISTAQLAQPIAHGALVLALDTDFDGCMRIVEQVTAEESIYLANSMNSLRIEGQKTVAVEIAQQLNWEVPDWVVIPAGNLGNTSALGRGFLMLKQLGLTSHLPRMACAQTEKANPLYLSYRTGFEDYRSVTAQPTLATAIQIGDPVSYKRAVKTLQEFDGVVEQATESELANACAMADRTGLYTCPQTGTALAVARKLRERGDIKKSDHVVVISTAHGLKFTDFKVGYHEQTLEGIDTPLANPLIQLSANADAVIDTIERELERRS